ncbi:MAG: PorT family protein [Cyclobacteriaceae bacterium]|nr:PorT family protein [Cyclobacteriaceae bacterium]
MRLFIAFVLVVFSTGLHAQDSENQKKEGRPNFPGTLYADLGIKYVGGVDYFKVIGSRTANFYYHYDLPIGNSKISFHPGIGVGLDRYKFSDSTNFSYTVINSADSSYFRPNKDLNISKSMLIAEYIDIPLELRFSSNASDPGHSFNVALGAKVGYLFRGMSKIKYSEGGETKKVKDIQSFHLTDLRYGAYLRVGTGGFNLFANYMITPLFKANEGHNKETMNAWTFGMSFVVF